MKRNGTPKSLPLLSVKPPCYLTIPILPAHSNASAPKRNRTERSTTNSRPLQSTSARRQPVNSVKSVNNRKSLDDLLFEAVSHDNDEDDDFEPTAPKKRKIEQSKSKVTVIDLFQDSDKE